jgi:hypothetical protein
LPQLPEAACSVNIRFRVEGYGDAQATGRGTSPAEAAQNLRQTIDATRLALAPEGPPVPPTRAEQVAHLLSHGLTKALIQGDTGLVERLAKAAALVLGNAVEPTDSPAVMAVRSAHEPSTWYEVANGMVCTCKDWEKHHRAGDGRYRCKHVLCVLMSARMTA